MIILVNKPKWRTSHDVVKFVKYRWWYKKVWHAGTLDPWATGLLILLTDEDTKQMATLVWHDKRYSATIDLSHLSDTRDEDYHEFYEALDVSEKPTQEQVLEVLQSLVPTALLPIPSFSAKKKDGKRLYETARKGVVHEEMKQMDIHEIQLLEYSFPYVKIRCFVWSGTFIRSIAHVLGQKLGTGGIIKELHRETIGEFSIDDPNCIQDIQQTFIKK